MKTHHYFDVRKGEPPYWLRNDPREIEEHRRMVREHERVHRARRLEARQEVGR